MGSRGSCRLGLRGSVLALLGGTLFLERNHRALGGQVYYFGDAVPFVCISVQTHASRGELFYANSETDL